MMKTFIIKETKVIMLKHVTVSEIHGRLQVVNILTNTNRVLSSKTIN